MQTESVEENPSPVKVNFSVELSRGLSNNHHVVPIGILMVLCTIYLMIAGLQSNYNYYLKPRVAVVELPERNVDVQDKQVSKDLGVQPQPLCRKVEIFSKELFTVKEANESRRIKRRKLLKSGNGIRHHARALKITEAKRRRDISKKSNTAEPIIYLFALVFIYLLLRAASDINQHYKTNKGDKRLRRCSLQSYAQKEQRHHQDRRASKGISTKSLPKF